MTGSDRWWLRAHLIAAIPLAVLSLVGIVGLAVFDLAELTFSFQGAIQAFAIFPGFVLSLGVNGLLLRARRTGGLSRAEKVLLGIEGGFLVVLVVLHFIEDADGLGLGLAIMIWPFAILSAIVAGIVIAVRTVTLRSAAPTPYGPQS